MTSENLTKHVFLSFEQYSSRQNNRILKTLNEERLQSFTHFEHCLTKLPTRQSEAHSTVTSSSSASSIRCFQFQRPFNQVFLPVYEHSKFVQFKPRLRQKQTHPNHSCVFLWMNKTERTVRRQYQYNVWRTPRRYLACFDRLLAAAAACWLIIKAGLIVAGDGFYRQQLDSFRYVGPSR